MVMRVSVGVAVCAGILLAGCASPAPPSEPVSTSTTLPEFGIRNYSLSDGALSNQARSGDVGLDVWMFDIGQGSCVVIDCPDGDRPIVVDCGSSAVSVRNAQKDVLSRASSLVSALGTPAVVISHGDDDHFSLLPDLLKAGSVEAVWLGGREAEYEADQIKNWFRKVRAAGTSVDVLPARFSQADDRDLHCGSAKVDILIANATGQTTNGDSIVLAVSLGDVTIVLPGDAIGDTERLALQTKNDIPRLRNARSIVVGSHHGAKTAGSNGMLESGWETDWSPVATIFSMRASKHKHPDCAVVERYATVMPPFGPSYTFTCGENGQVANRVVASRMLSTHDHGDLLLRIRPTRTLYLCQFEGPPCSGGLPANAYID